ncbi:hypothetical protein [Roseivivax sp. CAU 1761]
MTDRSDTRRSPRPEEALAILAEQLSYYEPATPAVRPERDDATDALRWTRAA